MPVWLLVAALIAAFGGAVTLGLLLGFKAITEHHQPRHVFPIDLDAEDGRRTAWLEKP